MKEFIRNCVHMAEILGWRACPAGRDDGLRQYILSRKGACAFIVFINGVKSQKKDGDDLYRHTPTYEIATYRDMNWVLGKMGCLRTYWKNECDFTGFDWEVNQQEYKRISEEYNVFFKKINYEEV